jgi:hypothetical protein
MLDVPNTAFALLSHQYAQDEDDIRVIVHTEAPVQSASAMFWPLGLREQVRRADPCWAILASSGDCVSCDD